MEMLMLCLKDSVMGNLVGIVASGIFRQQAWAVETETRANRLEQADQN